MIFNDILRAKLALDLGSEPFDGTLAPLKTFEIKAKGLGILCGTKYIPTIVDIVEREFFLKTLLPLSPVEIKLSLQEGDVIIPGMPVAKLTGNSEVLLKAERTILNILSELSGIATYTKSQVRRVKKYNVDLLDTRKDDPLMRSMHKHALTIGGGKPHRFGFPDGVLIKDNDIAVYGGIKQAIDRRIRELKHQTKMEIEVRTLGELDQVIADGRVDIILLDNMDIETLCESVKRIKTASKPYVIEASGIQEYMLEEVAKTGVSCISSSMFVRKGIAEHIDFSMKIVNQ